MIDLKYRQDYIFVKRWAPHMGHRFMFLFHFHSRIRRAHKFTVNAKTSIILHSHEIFIINNLFTSRRLWLKFMAGAIYFHASVVHWDSPVHHHIVDLSNLIKEARVLDRIEDTNNHLSLLVFFTYVCQSHSLCRYWSLGANHSSKVCRDYIIRTFLAY